MVGEVAREVLPLAAGAVQIADRVEDLANVERSGPSWAGMSAEARFNQDPLLIGQITRVDLADVPDNHRHLLR